jgi:hypothetical protein
MVTVQKRVRMSASFRSTVTVTVPLPVPLLGLTVTHGQGLVAVHEQFACVVTLTTTVPPNRLKVASVGIIEYVHSTGKGEPCVTANSLPAMVSVHVRSPRGGIPGSEGMGCAVTITVPFPVPLLGLTVTHGHGLVAVHAHPVGALTATDTLPPVFGNVWLVRLIEYMHTTRPPTEKVVWATAA